MKINYVSVKLVRDKETNYTTLFNVNSPSSVVTAFNNLFDLDMLANENMVMLMLNTKNQIIGVNTISQGTVNSSLVNPREVYQTALLQGAVSIIIAHNHPSGNSQPSSNDIDATKRLKQAGDIIGINLLDHIIIGDNNYTSLKEDGYIL